MKSEIRISKFEANSNIEILKGLRSGFWICDFGFVSDFEIRISDLLGADMKSEEYRQLTDEQLDLSLKDVVKNLFHLRFQSATERLETPSEIRKAKREVARIKTVQRERQLRIRGAAPTLVPAEPGKGA
jgi:ribosomal protein L29